MGFTSDWTPSERPEVPCPKCSVPGQIEWRGWESSCGGYDDYKYRCNACGHTWWVEGPDA
jgi:RecJ-like exonuclease